MASNKLVFTGLLCFIHVTHSYVLLTADMKDISQIARKFMSDSLADKITKFIAKALDNMGQVSEENEKHGDELQDISTVNNNQSNIGGQGYDKTTKSTVGEYTEPETRNTNINYEKMTSILKKLVKMYESQSKEDYTTHKIEAEQMPWVTLLKLFKPDYAIPTRKPNQKVNLKNNERHRRPSVRVDRNDHIHKYIYNKESKKYAQKVKKNESEHQKYRYEPIPQNERYDENQKERYDQNRKERYDQNTQKERYDQNTQKERYLSTVRHIGSTILYAEQPIYDTQPNSSNLKKPIHRGHRLTAFDSNESDNNIHDPIHKSGMSGFNIERVTPLKLTTEKQMAEFDQYDNPNYPRSEFIATSGPVALPKVPLQKPWWEKELPADNQRKVWY